MGRHKKPILLANIDNFWQPLFALIDYLRATEFICPSHDVGIQIADDVEDIVPRLRAAIKRCRNALTER
ncbi:hypothetical protein CSIRO_0060 [Bradyrhizobiaceae bacterium SG-6C]|nr:hypothetical protein CSIRO_0060 [Bradyrhizobiaceae bacterium SG-6C]